MKKQTKVEKASEKYIRHFNDGYMLAGSRQAAFLAGAAWQKRQDVAAVRAELQYSLNKIHIDGIVDAIKRAGK